MNLAYRWTAVLKRGIQLLLIIAAANPLSGAATAREMDFVLSNPKVSVTVTTSPELATRIRQVSQQMLVFVLQYPSMAATAEAAARQPGSVRFIVSLLRVGGTTRAERLVQITEKSRSPSKPGRAWRTGEQDGRLVYADPLPRGPAKEILVFKGSDGEWVAAAMPLMRSRVIVAERRFQTNLGVRYEYPLDLHLSPEQADRFALEAVRKHLRTEARHER